jgi:flagellar motor switch protein FliN
VAFDLEGGTELAQRVMAIEDGEAPEPAIAETLLELCGQALSGLAQKPEFRSLRFADPVMEAGGLGETQAAATIVAADRCRARVAVGGQLTPAPRAAEPQAAPEAPAPIAAAPGNLDVILDIELPLTVRFGETSMTLQAMAELTAGSTIDLQRPPDAPVDVLVNGRIVARGEVVVVAGNYGVRITQVIHAPARRPAAA